MTALIRFFTLILMLTATPAAAQLSVPPKQTTTFVCAEKSDAYKLALADMEGTLGALVPRFTEEGRCAWLPATYLFTVDQYTDSDGKPSRVIEMMVLGESVWAIVAGIPPGTWLISF